MTLGQEFEAFAVTTGEDIARLERDRAALPRGQPRRHGHRHRDQRRPALPRSSSIERAAPDHRPRRGARREPGRGDARTPAPSSCSPACSSGSRSSSRRCATTSACSPPGRAAGSARSTCPPMQPGSSIMPGKVNPVIPEVVNQVAFQVIGNDLTITLAAEAGQLQLNVMEPVIAFNAVPVARDAHRRPCDTLSERCIRGITANRERCRAHGRGLDRPRHRAWCRRSATSARPRSPRRRWRAAAACARSCARPG